MTQKALCILVGPRGVPRQIKGSAAAAEGENHRDTQTLSLFVGLSASHLFAEGGSQLRARKLKADVVTAITLHKLDVVSGVVRSATEVELQIRLVFRGLLLAEERRAAAFSMSKATSTRSSKPRCQMIVSRARVASLCHRQRALLDKCVRRVRWAVVRIHPSTCTSHKRSGARR